MLSKFLRSSYKSQLNVLLLRKVPLKVVQVRYADLIPKSQYDMTLPKKLNLIWAMKTYWEIIPLITATACALMVMFYSIMWACGNKVDVLFSTHNRNCISRTMDLRNPSIHKIFIINQRYEPWPEMQDVLDKMRLAEKRALTRVQTCSLVN